MCPLRPNPLCVSGLPADGQRSALRFSPEEVGAALADAGWEDVGPAALLEAHLRVLPSGPDVSVNGRLDTRVRYRCVRCLTPFEAPLEGTFHVTLRRQDGAVPGERELGEADLESEAFLGDTVDLTAVVSEHFFVELQPHPVCRPECRGLCPRCGADRNATACGCPQGGGSRPFEILGDRARARRA
ncbi:MAG: DUF177 domain-containing protein [Deferrisomatales bacterium]